MLYYYIHASISGSIAVGCAERKELPIVPPHVDRTALRQRYSQLVRSYHPDRNGGDRSLEAKLRAVIDAYQLLKGAAAFA